MTDDLEVLKDDVKYLKDVLNSIYISMYGIDTDKLKHERIKRIIDEIDKGEITVKDGIKLVNNK